MKCSDYIVLAWLFFLILFILSFPSQWESHPIQSSPLPQETAVVYPRRVNMSQCPPLFGSIGVFIAHDSMMAVNYKVALQSVQCYLRSVPYQFFLVDLYNEPAVVDKCGWHNNIFFRKHCAASLYLHRVDWLVVLDADTGIVNPDHCIEEWIDTRVDIIMYERGYNWEIMAGNYIVRNSAIGRRFLHEWAESERMGAFGEDQATLPYVLLNISMPEAAYEASQCMRILKKIPYSQSRNGRVITQLFASNTCCKLIMGATRMWKGKLRLLRRFHGWARDSYISDDKWTRHVDFMIHGWKRNQISDAPREWNSPFTKIPNPAECGRGVEGWNWREDKIISVDQMRTILSDFEKLQQEWFPAEARELPFLRFPDIRECYPNCEG